MFEMKESENNDKVKLEYTRINSTHPESNVHVILNENKSWNNLPV